MFTFPSSAKRNPEGGIESLRAIPWTFAWSQIRLHLPAWYGVNEALDCKVGYDGMMIILLNNIEEYDDYCYYYYTYYSYYYLRCL